MTKLANISPEATLVLVAELISSLERQRETDGRPSLVADLKTAIANASVQDPAAATNLRVGMADAQLVLAWVEKRLTPEDLHFGDLVAGAPKKR